jgi:hypothetical protein
MTWKKGLDQVNTGFRTGKSYPNAQLRGQGRLHKRGTIGREKDQQRDSSVCEEPDRSTGPGYSRHDAKSFLTPGQA